MRGWVLGCCLVVAAGLAVGCLEDVRDLAPDQPPMPDRGSAPGSEGARQANGSTSGGTNGTEGSQQADAGLAIPACEGQRFTEHPANPETVESFQPLGGFYPHGHTLATPHTSIMFEDEGTIRAPGTLYVTGVDETIDHQADEHGNALEHDYTVGFSLCEDVRGYFQHLETLSEEIEAELGEPRCERPDRLDGRFEYCSHRTELVLEPGDPIGTKEGGVEWGMMDLREQADLANPDRYEESYLGTVCPLDLATEQVRSALLDLSIAEGPDPCGTIERDVPGTLAGFWFHTTGYDGTVMDTAYDRQLTFATRTPFSNMSAIVVGGTLTEPVMLHLEPGVKGVRSDAFDEVPPDGTIHCYESTHPGKGSILARLEDVTTLTVEHRDGACPAEPAFEDPRTYRR